MPSNDNAILITGANGFLGGLIVGEALSRTDADLVLPLREPMSEKAEDVIAALAEDAVENERTFGRAEQRRLHFVPLPLPERMEELLPVLEHHGVSDVIHCAGCLSYFDTEKLQRGNVDLTRALLSLAKTLDSRRFVYLSTAYCSGFRPDSIPERIHESGVDPTAYTASKRQTEQLVAESGVPWIIVRPSVVVGDSRNGRYRGKPFGVYQLWSGYQKFLQDVYPEVLHIIAADAPINFIHQDAFVEGFWAAYENLPAGSIIHIASREDQLPTMRQLIRMWLDHYGGPREVHLYDKLADVPMSRVHESERRWLEFTAVNSQIASMRWDFELHALTALRETGLRFVDASLETLEACQKRFVSDSPKLAEFIEEYRRRGSRSPRIVTASVRRSSGELSDAAE